MTCHGLPNIIQGGMGVAVSSWHLASTVARAGLLGVVSGTALDIVVARRLQLGDVDGSVRRALEHFPWPAMAARVLDAYFVAEGKPADTPFQDTPRPEVRFSRAGAELLIVSNFVEVFLAKEEHDGPIGINYLEKIQLPTLPSLFGAMVAGVDVVLMGAGIPLAIPGILDRLARWEPVELALSVAGALPDDEFVQHFDPCEFAPAAGVPLTRPAFLAIVSSDVAARTMLRRATGEIDGFVVEGHEASGHNAPPRRAERRDADAPLSFGIDDEPQPAAFRELDKPFWLAGAHASPAGLRQALDDGANGIQVGTAFAFCDESGMREDLRHRVLTRHAVGTLTVHTDFHASPTGYPFKFVELPGTTADLSVLSDRARVCDLGYLTEAYRDEDGAVGFRCPGEPVAEYLAKGGEVSRVAGARCLCNGLLATVGLGQTRGDVAEPPIVTAGRDFSFLEHVAGGNPASYSALDVIAYLRS